MSDRLKKRFMRVVGVRQVLRALKEDRAEEVYLAMDADASLRSTVERAALLCGVPLRLVATMEELAALCQVDVPSAAAAVCRTGNRP